MKQAADTDTTAQTSSPKQLSEAQGLGCLALLMIPLVSLLAYAVNRGLAYSRGEIAADQALGTPDPCFLVPQRRWPRPFMEPSVS